jgi:hypothetical protein
MRGVLLFLALTGCAFDPAGTDVGTDAAPSVDAEPRSSMADADPSAPDADPTLPDSAIPDAGEPITLTFQDGTDGYAGTLDTYVDGNSPNNSYGSLSSFEWDTGGASTVGLLRFTAVFGAGIDHISPDASIIFVSLTVFVSGSGSGSVGDVHEALSDWDEAVTWNSMGATAGVQAEDLGARVADAPVSNGTHVRDITSSVAAWSAQPASNLGWVFVPTNGDGVHILTRESGTVSQHPLLTITYQP